MADGPKGSRGSAARDGRRGAAAPTASPLRAEVTSGAAASSAASRFSRPGLPSGERVQPLALGGDEAPAQRLRGAGALEPRVDVVRDLGGAQRGVEPHLAGRAAERGGQGRVDRLVEGQHEAKGALRILHETGEAAGRRGGERLGVVDREDEGCLGAAGRAGARGARAEGEGQEVGEGEGARGYVEDVVARREAPLEQAQQQRLSHADRPAQGDHALPGGQGGLEGGEGGLGGRPRHVGAPLGHGREGALDHFPLGHPRASSQRPRLPATKRNRAPQVFRGEEGSVQWWTRGPPRRWG